MVRSLLPSLFFLLGLPLTQAQNWEVTLLNGTLIGADTVAVCEGTLLGIRDDFGWSGGVNYNLQVNGSTISHNLPAPTYVGGGLSIGTHYLRVRATNQGQQYFDTIYLSIVPAAEVSMSGTADSACHPMTVHFNNTSPTPNLDLEWYVNGQLVSTAPSYGQVFTNTSHMLDSVYEVTMVGTSAAGCSDSAVAEVRVFPKPLAAFEVSAGGCSGTVTVENESIGKDSGGCPEINKRNNGNGGKCPGDNGMPIWPPFVGTPFGNVPGSGKEGEITFDVDTCQTGGMVPAITDVLVNGVTYGGSMGNNPVEFGPPTLISIVDSCTLRFMYCFYNSNLPSLNFFSVVFSDPNSGTVYSVCTYDQSDLLITDSLQYTWSVTPPTVGIQSLTDASPTFSFPPNNSGFDSTYTIQLIVSSADGCSDTATEQITITSGPMAGFGLPAGQCAPASVTPFDSSYSANGPGSYLWQVDPSAGVSITGDSTAAPVFQFPAVSQDSVVYNITQIVTDTSGCSDTLTLPYVVYAPPTANFQPLSDTVCALTPISFLNLSDPNITGQDTSDLTYFWDFGNGQTSAATNPQMSFSGSGSTDTTYTITLIVTNAFGCSDTATGTVTVTPPPTSILSLTANAGCPPLLIDTALISGVHNSTTNSGYLWEVLSVPGGALLYSQGGLDSLGYLLSTPGDTVLVRLIAYGHNGCPADTAEQLIYTHLLPATAFTATPDSGCSPLEPVIVFSPEPGTTPIWYLNGSQIATGPAPLISLTNSSTTTDSTYTLLLVVTDTLTGCSDSASATFVVHPQPQAAFDVPGPSCGSDTLALNNQSLYPAGSSFLWSSNSPGLVFTDSTAQDPGIWFPAQSVGDSTILITLLVTTPYGCTADTALPVTFFSSPQAAFSLPASSCGPTSVSPAESSTGIHAPLTYAWSIAPQTGVTAGGTATSAPTFQLPVPPVDSTVYQITLLVTDTNGCRDSLTLPYVVYARPAAALSASAPSGCGPLDVLFTSTSTPNITGQDTADLIHYWNSGGGFTAGGSQLSVTFPAPVGPDTVYTVQLAVENTWGCSDTAEIQVQVFSNPTVDLQLADSAGCAPLVLDTGLVTTTYQADSLLWEVFAAGTGSLLFSGSSLNYTISAAGDSVWVRLIGFNDAGCAPDTSEQLFYTLGVPAPAILATPDSGCSPLTVQFNGSSTPGVQHQWTINGTPVSNSPNPAFTFTNNSSVSDSTVIIGLILTDSIYGCPDTNSQAVVIHPIPIPLFDLAPSCSADSVQVTNLSSAPAGSSWAWSGPAGLVFDDASAFEPTLFFPSFQGTADTTLLVTLTATGPNGCPADTTLPVTFTPRPTANFSVVDPVCGNYLLQPVDQSSALHVPISYNWTVSPSSGVTGSGLNTSAPSFLLPQPATDSALYLISLAVTDSNGCSDSVTLPVTVYPTPEASFVPSANSGCGPLTVAFTSTSDPNFSGQDTANLAHQWTFSNGVTSSSSAPQVVFDPAAVNDTTYFVQLIVTNMMGCSDTITDSITVFPQPQALLSVNDSAACAPFAFDTSWVSALPHPTNGSYTWEVVAMDGTVLATQPGIGALNHTITGIGDSVIVQLIATAANGCGSDTARQLVYSHGYPIANFSAAPDSGCSPLNVTLTNNSFQATGYNWLLDGVSFSTAASPSLVLTNSGSNTDSVYTITLVVTSANGCSDTTQQQVTVFPTPLPLFSVPGTACSADSLAVTNLSSVPAGSSWAWSGPAGLVFDDATAFEPTLYFPSFQGTADTTLLVTLSATGPNGCPADTTLPVTFTPRPTANFTVVNPVCGNYLVEPLDQSSALHVPISYNWTVSPSAGVVTAGTSTSTPSFLLPQPAADSTVYLISLSVTDTNGCSDSITHPVTVYPSPEADFTLSAGSGCGPLSVSFTSTSDPNFSGQDTANLAHQWTFSNGVTSSSSAPQVVFDPAAVNDTTYFVQLIVTNMMGCSDTITDTITVFPQPQALLSVNDSAACAPFAFDTSWVSAVPYPTNGSYTWEVVAMDGTVLATQPGIGALNHTITGIGDSVIVQLIAMAANGCGSDTARQLVYSHTNPTAAFALQSDTGCSPLTPTVVNSSQGAVSYQWYVNGQPVSNLAVPTFSWTNPGTADSTVAVSLVTTNAFGCKDSVSSNALILGDPQISFAHSTSCLGDSAQFAGTANRPAQSWTWDFGDGTTGSGQSTGHVYALPGDYVVALTVTDLFGCTATITDTVHQTGLPTAMIQSAYNCQPTQLCAGDSLSLISTSVAYSAADSLVVLNWDIGADGTVEYTGALAYHIFSDTGTYSIRLVVESTTGCRDTAEIFVEVIEPPVASFALAASTGCGPFNATVSNTSTGVITSTTWNLYGVHPGQGGLPVFSSGSASPAFPTLQAHPTADTLYFIELSVSNCCGVSTALDTVRIRPTPTAALLASPDSGCSPLPVTFQLDGQIQGNPGSVSINYGDGSGFTTLTPAVTVQPNGDTVYTWGQQSHTFLYSGFQQDTTYLVTLVAENACGSDTVTEPITVYPDEVQSFFTASPLSGCAPLTVNFTSGSFGASGYTWCFEYDPVAGQCGPFTAAGNTASHTFVTGGTYTVALIAENLCASDTSFLTIQVNPAPAAGFTHNGPVCDDDTVRFTNTSVISSGQINQYFWDFGDGSTSTQTSPEHVYAQPGTYTVCLMATSSFGCWDSICQTVQITAPPAVSFTGADACLNEQPVQFTNTSTAGTGSISGVLWNFGDGNTSVQANPQHTYAAPGLYTVTLTVQNSSGCMDSLAQTVNIHGIPLANFAAQRLGTDSCGAPQSYQFLNASSGAAGYEWDFDFTGNPGANVSTANSPNFTYTNPGLYVIRLIAQNPNGCPDTTFQQVEVRPAPQAVLDLDAPDGCLPHTVNFTDVSTYSWGGGSITGWFWDFGDGNTSSSQNPTHTFNTAGTYAVTLAVQTDAGCWDTIDVVQTVQVYEAPVADFDWTIKGAVIELHNLSTVPDNSTEFLWSFGDGSTSTEFEPTHHYYVDLYENSYTFVVCLVAKRSGGCMDSICRTLDLEGLRLNVPNAFTPDLTQVGDGNVFLPKGHSLRNYRVQVFDSWGNKVFESTSLDANGIPNEPWNGRAQNSGEILPMGAYVWRVDAVFVDGTRWPGQMFKNGERYAHGTVTLIR